MLKKFLLMAAVITLFAGAAHAADVKTYQVTGPVLEITDTTITVKKDGDKWQIAKGAATVPAKTKVGTKVTIQYTMTATKIEDKSK